MLLISTFIAYVKNGKGVIKYTSGRIYEGDFVNDYRHGVGFEVF